MFAASLWLVIYFRGTFLPFISDIEAVLGLPGFLAVSSGAFALFNLLPIPPLDGGRLALIALENVFGAD
jgi:membrane-associated protease RseP (regulator of RpoE activity)